MRVLAAGRTPSSSTDSEVLYAPQEEFSTIEELFSLRHGITGSENTLYDWKSIYSFSFRTRGIVPPAWISWTIPLHLFPKLLNLHCESDSLKLLEDKVSAEHISHDFPLLESGAHSFG